MPVRYRSASTFRVNDLLRSFRPARGRPPRLGSPPTLLDGGHQRVGSAAACCAGVGSSGIRRWVCRRPAPRRLPSRSVTSWSSQRGGGFDPGARPPARPPASALRIGSAGARRRRLKDEPPQRANAADPEVPGYPSNSATSTPSTAARSVTSLTRSGLDAASIFAIVDCCQPWSPSRRIAAADDPAGQAQRLVAPGRAPLPAARCFSILHGDLLYMLAVIDAGAAANVILIPEGMQRHSGGGLNRMTKLLFHEDVSELTRVPSRRCGTGGTSAKADPSRSKSATGSPTSSKTSRPGLRRSTRMRAAWDEPKSGPLCQRLAGRWIHSLFV